MFIVTAFFAPSLFPAAALWRHLGNPVIFRRFIGISR